MRARLPDFAQLRAGQLEAVKWVALAFMLLEHFWRYAIGDMPPAVYQAGRIAFPLFAFALALGLGSKPCVTMRAVLVRIFAWAAIAQIACLTVEVPLTRLNVLFTLGLGLLGAYALSCEPRWWRAAIFAVPIAILGWHCEFGLWGVGLVFALLQLARSGWESRNYWLLTGLMLATLAIPNRSISALLAVPAAYLVILSGLAIPRIRRVFYWIYVAQFPAFALIRQWWTGTPG